MTYFRSNYVTFCPNSGYSFWPIWRNEGSIWPSILAAVHNRARFLKKKFCSRKNCIYANFSFLQKLVFCKYIESGWSETKLSWTINLALVECYGNANSPVFSISNGYEEKRKKRKWPNFVVFGQMRQNGGGQKSRNRRIPRFSICRTRISTLNSDQNSKKKFSASP